MRHGRIGAVIAMVVALDSPSPGWAQQAGPGTDKGSYGGVVPGKSTVGKSRGRKTVHWVGFQRREDGGARIFVQLGTGVDYTQWLEGKVLFVLLNGARIANANARRPLDTRFFETAVASVRARRVSARKAKGSRPAHRAGVLLEIRFRNAADASEASAIMNSSSDGYTYLNLDFGAGSAGGEVIEPEADEGDAEEDEE
jgi:hypothetical protein